MTMYDLFQDNINQDTYIVITYFDLPFGKQRIEFEWRGEGNTAIVGRHDSRRFLPRNPKPGMQFWLGHLSLVVIDWNMMAQRAIVGLDDGRAYQAAYIRAAYYALDNIYRRLILTAHVWGFANYIEYQVPSWRDVHVLRRLAKWWSK